MLFSLVPEPWRDVLAPHEELINFIGRELQQRADKGERILPDRKWVFRSLEMPPEDVKVIIVGQDPYPNISDAVGLAFSVAPRKSGLPGSLMNIQKEIITDIGSTTTSDGDLSRWSSRRYVAQSNPHGFGRRERLPCILRLGRIYEIHHCPCGRKWSNWSSLG